MIKINNDEVFGFEQAIRGMRNPKNSWDKSDSEFNTSMFELAIGENDYKLMEEVDSLYDSIESGVISINELIQDTAEMGNLKSKYFDILKNDKDMWDKINWGEVK